MCVLLRYKQLQCEFTFQVKHSLNIISPLTAGKRFSKIRCHLYLGSLLYLVDLERNIGADLQKCMQTLHCNGLV